MSRAAAPERTSMREALHAEWTKLRTTPGPGWLLLAVAALTVGVSAGIAAAVRCPSAGCDLDATKISLTGVELGQAVVVVLGVLAIGGEYGTGLIHVTFAAMPRRHAVLAAKAAVVAAVVLTAGTVAVLGSVVAGHFILPGHGFTPAHGYPPLSLAEGPTLRAAVGSVLYLALIGLFSLGVATAVRDSATAVGIVLSLLYVFPILIHLVTDPRWQRHLQQIAPMEAGLGIQSTIDLHHLALAPWAGLGVLAAWAASSMILGAAVLHVRDA